MGFRRKKITKIRPRIRRKLPPARAPYKIGKDWEVSRILELRAGIGLDVLLDIVTTEMELEVEIMGIKIPVETVADTKEAGAR